MVGPEKVAEIGEKVEVYVCIYIHRCIVLHSLTHSMIQVAQLEKEAALPRHPAVQGRMGTYLPQQYRLTTAARPRHWWRTTLQWVAAADVSSSSSRSHPTRTAIVEASAVQAQ